MRALDELLLLSETMVAEAEKDDWDKVANLEIIRQDKIKKLFENYNINLAHPDDIEKIKELIRINSILMAIGEQERNRVLSKSAENVNAIKAVMEYSNNS